MHRTLGAAVALLVALGLFAAIGRGFFAPELAVGAEELRQDLLRAMGVRDPSPAQRAADFAEFHGRYDAHPLATNLHVLFGGLFLLLAPLQFVARLRNRHPRLHRWSGRVLIVCAIAATLSGFYFGLLIPFAGAGESLVIALVGALLLFAMTKGVLAIRAHDVVRHRQWMLRAFGVALGVSTVRLAGIVADLTLTPAGVDPRTAFILSLWTGWAVSVFAAEMRIRAIEV